MQPTSPSTIERSPTNFRWQGHCGYRLIDCGNLIFARKELYAKQIDTGVNPSQALVRRSGKRGKSLRIARAPAAPSPLVAGREVTARRCPIARPPPPTPPHKGEGRRSIA